jgi:hypothetical protein
MNQRAKSITEGTGIMVLTKSQAGEAYKAARAYKPKNDFTYWRRNKQRKGTK